METVDIQTNGVRLHVKCAGPQDGPLVVLLHGFPEMALSWKHYLERLGSLGYRVLAPDQRGYGSSDKPKGRLAYRSENLVDDVIGILDQEGREKATIVGHDWGAAVAWMVGLQYPDRVERLVTLNVPHPMAFMKRLFTDLGQLRRSWYMFFFQLPFLPEKAVFGPKGMAEQIKRAIKDKAIAEELMPAYRAAWDQTDSQTGMISWYRAMFLGRPPRNKRLPMPVLLIWGKKDPFLKFEMAYESMAFCDNGRLEMIEDAGHFVQHDALPEVSRILEEFLPGEKAKAEVETRSPNRKKKAASS